MKSKDSKQHRKQKITINKKNTRSRILPGIIISGVIIGFLFWKRSTISQSENKSTTTTTPESTSFTADQKNLVGRWTRTDSDGAYVIEIRNVGAEGKLEANYFNPNPIKVGHAEWQQKNDKLIVIVELRDVNYPGSTYTLNFFPSENRMTGNYYQAVQGQNFEVEFTRTR